MASWQPFDWYADDLRWYDMVFDAETDREADFLDGIHAQFVTSRGRRLLEPACGTGRLLRALAKRGWRTTGFDLSEPAVQFARTRLADAGLTGRVVAGDLADVPVRGPFDLAHCLVSTFRHVTTRAAATSHLRRMAEVLAPGGVYVLGLHMSEYDVDQCSHERWVVQDDNAMVVCNIRSWPADRVTRTEAVRSRLRVTEAGSERRLESRWNFRTYDASELRELIASAPGLEHVATYTFDYDLTSPTDLDGDRLDVVLILRRRA